METEKPGQRLHIIYYGRVQGVGFRQTVLRVARRHPVTGFVRNLLDGTVEMVLEGSAAGLAQMQIEISQLFHRNITHADLHEEATTGEFSKFEVR